MLWLMDMIGALLLILFLARTEAWTDERDQARRIRLFVGPLIVGLITALLVYVKWPDAIWFSSKNATRAWVAFGGLPLALIAVTFLLESLNKRIK